VTCPGCNRHLSGLGTFCWACQAYTADLPRPVPETDDDPMGAARPADPRSEKEIQAAVVNALKAMGFCVWDTSQPFAAKITPGLPDLFVSGRGFTAWVECKSAKGKLSDAQERFRDSVTTNGGTHMVARHEADVIAWAEQLALGLTL